MRKMSPKDGKQEKGGEQTPAPAAAASTAAPDLTQGETALPDLLAGLFEVPVQPDAGDGTAQPGGAASLMAALVQPDGAATAQMAPALAAATQGQPAATQQRTGRQSLAAHGHRRRSPSCPKAWSGLSCRLHPSPRRGNSCRQARRCPPARIWPDWMTLVLSPA
ncbi:hypothetical protein V6L77_14365 [Pannonibacter sp. Pt2-lr]